MWAWDTAGNVVSTGRGAYSIYNDGPNFGNVLQTVGGGAGFTGNILPKIKPPRAQTSAANTVAETTGRAESKALTNTAESVSSKSDGAAGAVGRQPNRIYSARELIRRTEEPGPFHNFPESFNDQIFAGNRRVISPDYIQYATRGAINLPGKPIYGRGSVVVGGERVRPIIGHTPSRIVEGTFEIGVRPSASGRTEVIIHRFFRQD